MPALSGEAKFAALAQRLKDAGETGLRRRLYKAISDAGEPLAAELKNPEHLRPYMPNRYADVLAADLNVTIYKRAGDNPSLQVRAESRQPRNRKVIQIDEGVLRHPLFADRERWFLQLRGMRAGFFSDAVDHTGALVREKIIAACDDTSRQIMDG